MPQAMKVGAQHILISLFIAPLMLFVFTKAGDSWLSNVESVPVIEATVSSNSMKLDAILNITSANTSTLVAHGVKIEYCEDEIDKCREAHNVE